MIENFISTRIKIAYINDTEGKKFCKRFLIKSKSAILFFFPCMFNLNPVANYN